MFNIFNFFRKKKKTHDELVEIYVKAWQKLDANIIKPYIADDFVYGSMCVFNDIHGKKEYVSYLKDKFKNIKKSGSKIVAKVGESGFYKGVSAPRINQDGIRDAWIDIECKDGKIITAYISGSDKKTADNVEFDDSDFSSDAMDECLNWKPTECRKVPEKCLKCGHKLKPVYWGILNEEIEKQIRAENKYIIGMSCYGDIDNKPDFCCTNCGEAYKILKFLLH